MFHATDGDEFESRTYDEVRDERLVDVIKGRKGLNERIKYGIQLGESLDIAPLEVHVRCRVLGYHIIDVQEDPVEKFPELRTARERNVLTS